MQALSLLLLCARSRNVSDLLQQSNLTRQSLYVKFDPLIDGGLLPGRYQLFGCPFSGTLSFRMYLLETCFLCALLVLGSSMLLWPFPYLGSAHHVFNIHVLRSCAPSVFTCFSFMSVLITLLGSTVHFTLFLKMRSNYSLFHKINLSNLHF